MFQLFGNLKSFVKPKECVIDNQVFRLHYKFTFVVLIAFSLMVTARQYFGDPIDCIQRDDIPQRIIDTYCWIHATFTLPQAFDKKVGVEVPHPGVDKYTPGEQRIYHKYYQWVCFVLFLQALLFYTPHYLWKLSERGRLRALVKNLNSPIIPDDKREEMVMPLVKYFQRDTSIHNSYFLNYVVCETLCLVNVILQVYIIDAFLGGEFTTFGLDVLKWSETEQDFRPDPMVKIFPRMTKCTFHRFGSSGDVQRHDALCILPLNIINEKIYIFLWFWFALLTVLSCLITVYRLVTIFCPNVRYLVLRSKARLTSHACLKKVIENCSIGDWFLLYLINKNSDPLVYRDLIEELSKVTRNKSNKKGVDNDTNDTNDTNDHEKTLLSKEH